MATLLRAAHMVIDDNLLLQQLPYVQGLRPAPLRLLQSLAQRRDLAAAGLILPV
jgi:hypothetical protein